MRVESTGYGAGAKDFPTQPNLLRLQLGQTEPTDAQLVMLETQMDDINPEWLPPLRKKLLESGARDVWMTSISMKKERQGSLLSILCKPEHSADLRSILFRESTTFGIRAYPVTRYERESSFKTVESPFGACRVRCSEEGEFPLFVPEHEDCLKLSQTHSVPLRVVYEAVTAAAKAAFSPSTGEQP